MAHFIVVPKEELRPNIDQINDHLLSYLNGENIVLHRGDIIRFGKVNNVIINPSISNSIKINYYTGEYIFDGFKLEPFDVKLFLFGDLPCTYQFPEFPINHFWVNALNHRVWFDYRPYRQQMIDNLTFEKPEHIKIIQDSGKIDAYSFIVMGLNVKIYFVFLDFCRMNNLNVVKNIIRDDRYYALDYFEDKLVSDQLLMFSSHVQEYGQYDNVIYGYLLDT
jgi:hypothetical protein